MLWIQQFSSEQNCSDGSFAKILLTNADCRGLRKDEETLFLLSGTLFLFSCFFLLVSFHSTPAPSSCSTPWTDSSMLLTTFRHTCLILCMIYLLRILLSVMIANEWLSNPRKCYQQERVKTRFPPPLHSGYSCNWWQTNAKAEDKEILNGGVVLGSEKESVGQHHVNNPFVHLVIEQAQVRPHGT